MAFSRSMTAIIPGPVAAPRLSDGKTPWIHPFQIRCKRNSDFETPMNISFSRRDAIISLTALSAAVISMSSPDTAGARPKKGEMRRKIKEKLELLREKARVSKQKESDKEKENDLQLQLPSLQDRALVEATYDL